ncbi:phenylacetate--CoA ligase family protein [Thermogemmatispora tikiterensis]|uniref:Phenylacetate--CoA ligase n=1 Tax=Thermogemmatispora tikiterensis TaxID=1825093 RepID=A0A328VK04_9CHLR|nr:AMP-binding protein [Thermogemmatispora tikiterensis]RAQ95444.1 phenylacetate--CoA ligase [Thermogemmatispora tikiterensis]
MPQSNHPRLETASRSLIEARQLARLQLGLTRILPRNSFYERKLLANGQSLSLTRLRDLSLLPFTTKQELLADQERHPLYGENMTYALSEYVRYHQTSGTTGRPLRVLDTAESWKWWADCWKTVYQAAGVTRDDVIFIAFGFGPFIGFWAAYEGAKNLGALVVPGGGMDSLQRLRMMQDVQASVLVCTPSYALRLAEVARQEGFDLQKLKVRITIHAGEPGASIPATRRRIEEAWGAKAYDHAGMSEMGAYGFTCERQHGLHVNEGEFIAEILDPRSGQPVPVGEVGELVLTNLGRWGNPALRYRTGDLVRNGGYSCPCGRAFLLLPGGILGRIDDMLIVRGVNIYPSAIADVLHRFPEVAEYRIIVTSNGPLDEIALQVECPPSLVGEIQEALRASFGLRIPVEAVAEGSLPRFELKAKRVEDRRRRML